MSSTLKFLLGGIPARVPFAILFILLTFFAGCTDRESSSGTLQAATCRPWGDVFMEVRGGLSGGAPAFEDADFSLIAGYVGSGTPVTRELTQTIQANSNLGLPLLEEHDEPNVEAPKFSLVEASVYMQVRTSSASGGVPFYTDMGLTNVLGYVGPGTPVIRQLTREITKNGTQVVAMRTEIRGGSLANKVGWVQAVHLEPRSGTPTSNSASPTSSGSIRVMRVNVRGGQLANRTVWIRAENLTRRSGQDCGNAVAASQCPANTVYACDSASCRCMATGVAAEDPIGNFIIETLGMAGGGVLYRGAVSGGRAVIALFDDGLVAALRALARASTYDDAIRAMGNVIKGSNPLSGTSRVGSGNCANDAITQAVKLVFGRWACAIPYPENSMTAGNWNHIVHDAIAVFGFRKVDYGRYSMQQIESLVADLPEGGIAMLRSSSSGAGHATLIAKVKGRIVHINNQNWEPKFSTLSQWDELWKSKVVSENVSYQIHFLTKTIQGL